MATKKKSSKNSKKVDTILILLIAIVVLAVITLGIVLVISFNTPDIIEPDRNPGLVTDTTGSYSNYLTSTMESVGLKEVPVSGNEFASMVVLGTDNKVYVITNGENPDEITGSNDKKGVRYVNLENVVDVFEVTTSEGIVNLFALTTEGKLYALNINEPTSENSLANEYSCGKEIIEVDMINGELIATLYDNSTYKITDQC